MGKTKDKTLRRSFLVWQCDIRQSAMREAGGRPSSGMCPRVLDENGSELAPSLTVLLTPKEPEASTAFFRFQVLKSADPRETYEKALRYLQADYYQDPKSFGDRLLATLPSSTPLADALLASKRCVLEFAQGRYRYRLPCKVKALDGEDEDRAAALWHNRIFNRALPDTAQVLAFKPDWEAAETMN